MLYLLFVIFMFYKLGFLAGLGAIVLFNMAYYILDYVRRERRI